LLYSPSDINDLDSFFECTNYKLIKPKDCHTIKANHNYLLPENDKWIVKEGVLKTLNAEEAIALPFNFPNDILLDSFAQEQANNTFALKLSSQAEDGKRGLQILKSAGGIIFAPSQSPEQVATEIKRTMEKKRSHKYKEIVKETPLL
ncbi:MAG: hypothetical protein D6822_06505, partial [Cyanobacteria bacterium J149]